MCKTFSRYIRKPALRSSHIATLNAHPDHLYIVHTSILTCSPLNAYLLIYHLRNIPINWGPYMEDKNKNGPKTIESNLTAPAAMYSKILLCRSCRASHDKVYNRTYSTLEENPSFFKKFNNPEQKYSLVYNHLRMTDFLHCSGVSPVDLITSTATTHALVQWT